MSLESLVTVVANVIQQLGGRGARFVDNFYFGKPFGISGFRSESGVISLDVNTRPDLLLDDHRRTGAAGTAAADVTDSVGVVAVQILRNGLI